MIVSIATECLVITDDVLESQIECHKGYFMPITFSNVSECKVMHISNHNSQGGLRDKTLMGITREGDIA